MTPEAFEILMVKAIDGLATPQETATLMTWLSDHPDLRAEYDTQMGIKALTDGWVQRLEADLLEDQFREETQTTVEKRLGWSLLLIGFGVLIGGAGTALWTDPNVPTWVLLGYGILAAGFSILFLSVARWKWKTSQDDPYKEVIR